MILFTGADETNKGQKINDPSTSFNEGPKLEKYNGIYIKNPL